MKKLRYEDIDIAYTKNGTGRQAVVLLHGWGVDSSLMEPLVGHLKEYFTVYNLDWPGFGESTTPAYAFSTADYLRIFCGFVEKLKIKDPIIIAHSFGCRIALRYAALNPVKKMVLTGAAGLIPKRGIDYYFKVTAYKMVKLLRRIPWLQEIGNDRSFGSADYRAAQGVMRTIFVKVVNEDVKEFLPKVECEVLLVFGENDEDTPLWMGKYLEKALPNAGLAIFEHDDHYAYLHQLPRFLQVIDIFLKEEREDAGKH